jgi:hypothetical protein
VIDQHGSIALLVDLVFASRPQDRMVNSMLELEEWMHRDGFDNRKNWSMGFHLDVFQTPIRCLS